MEYQANPDNAELRMKVMLIIKKLYLKTGGTPIVTTSALPPKFYELKPDEMVNAVDNMLLYLNRTKKNDIVTKCFNIFTNFGGWFARMLDVPVKPHLFSALNDDNLLRDSVVSVFLGKSVNPSPASTLIISALSHLSNALPIYKSLDTDNPKEPRGGDGSQK